MRAWRRRRRQCEIGESASSRVSRSRREGRRLSSSRCSRCTIINKSRRSIKSGYKYYCLMALKATQMRQTRAVSRNCRSLSAVHTRRPRVLVRARTAPLHIRRVGHAMPECVVGARGTAYHQQQGIKALAQFSSGLHSAAVPASLPARSKFALSHLVDDEGDDQRGGERSDGAVNSRITRAYLASSVVGLVVSFQPVYL